MQRRELRNFYNEGFGWICKSCEIELKSELPAGSRRWSEGEAESKQPALSSPALAKWTDDDRKTLVCPRCGIDESVS